MNPNAGGLPAKMTLLHQPSDVRNAWGPGMEGPTNLCQNWATPGSKMTCFKTGLTHNSELMQETHLATIKAARCPLSCPQHRVMEFPDFNDLTNLDESPGTRKSEWSDQRPM
jgi:hypothetical protein